MNYRPLGRSGLRVSALSLGTMAFGGVGKFAKTGNTDVAGARQQVDLCLEVGVNLFDTADGYSAGASEEILGQALRGRRDQVLIATKGRFRVSCLKLVFSYGHRSLAGIVLIVYPGAPFQ